MGSQYKASDFIDAIPGSGGIFTTIARRVGCDWNTVRRWVDTAPTVAKALAAEKESVLDMAEGVVMKNIRDGDTSDAKWYLTKKGKHRGYVDRRQEVEHSGSVVMVNWDDDTNDSD